MAENYPELKADESFEELLDQLSETKDKIASYREVYNDIVLKYNNECEMFPSNIIANFFSFEENAFFETDKPQPPEVDFKVGPNL